MTLAGPVEVIRIIASNINPVFRRQVRQGRSLEGFVQATLFPPEGKPTATSPTRLRCALGYSSMAIQQSRQSEEVLHNPVHDRAPLHEGMARAVCSVACPPQSIRQ